MLTISFGGILNNENENTEKKVYFLNTTIT